MRKSILPAALVTAMALVGVAGSASAADTARANVDFDVDTMCNIRAVNDVHGYQTWDGSGPVVDHGTGQLEVLCNAGTNFQIVNDAGAGGAMNLIGQSTGDAVPAYIFQETIGGSPWSTIANGEQYSGVATGEPENFQYAVAFNTTADGSTYLPVPKSDLYQGEITWTIVYP